MDIPYEQLKQTLEEILIAHGVPAENAAPAAKNYADNSLDGVYSHGVDRFPRTVDYLDRGLVDGAARPVLLSAFGAMERWDGRMGLGNVNAALMMGRAIALAGENGIGLVAIQNTNHWMRGGAFGWQAAEAGCIGICWTNTTPNAPAWGGADNRIGNNPLIIAVPQSGGDHVVLDMAMTQFAYGKVAHAAMKGETLPVPGGYDAQGQLTRDPAAIRDGGRHLTIGYWKGSGLSILRDLPAAVLSGGKTVTESGKKYQDEVGLSQLFIAIRPDKFQDPAVSDGAIARVVEDIKNSVPAGEGGVSYPGERTLATRRRNLERGIPVLDEVWERIQGLR